MNRRAEPYAPPRGAAAHICTTTGGTVYRPLTECPYCDGGQR